VVARGIEPAGRRRWAGARSRSSGLIPSPSADRERPPPARTAPSRWRGAAARAAHATVPARSISGSGRLIAAPDVPRVPVHAAQQIAHAPLEGVVAVRAPQPARGPEVAQACRAERAPPRPPLPMLHLLVYRLQETRRSAACGTSRRLDTALGGAPLAQVQVAALPAPSTSSAHDRIAFLADVAHIIRRLPPATHPSRSAIHHPGAAPGRPGRERAVVRDHHHADLQIPHNSDQKFV
jgi:hypothetical protein